MYFHGGPRDPLVQRKTVAQYPPPFLERISCLVLIMGNSSLSKQGLGLGHRAKRRQIFRDPRTNSGRDFRHVPDSRIGLIMGDFMIQKVSRQPLTRRESRSLRPPIFRKSFPVWNLLWARHAIQGTIRAWMALEEIKVFPNDFRESSRRHSRFKIRACCGRVSVNLPLSGLEV